MSTFRLTDTRRDVGRPLNEFCPAQVALGDRHREGAAPAPCAGFVAGHVGSERAPFGDQPEHGAPVITDAGRAALSTCYICGKPCPALVCSDARVPEKPRRGSKHDLP